MDCNCEEKGLIVWRGFDTRFLDVDWLSISFETRFQTDGFRAKFTICDYSFEWNDLTQPKIINLTDTQTATIPIGLNYGELIVWDDDGNSKPFSTSIPIFCKNWAESDQELDTYNMTVNALLDNETQMVIKIETAKVSLDWVLEKIAEHNSREEAHPYIQGRIDDEITARENADSALSDRITENTERFANYRTSANQDTIDNAQNVEIGKKQDKLTSENAGVGISIEDVGGRVVISNTQTSAEWGNITGTLSNQTDLSQALAGKLTTSDILNVLNSTAIDKALSANMGKELNDRLNNVESRGRFLSVWDCATGLPETDPVGLETGDVYAYQRGDYYIVGSVSSGSGTNYRPNGSSYTVGTASTTVETEIVVVNDTYIYDGAHWILQQNVDREVTFGSVAGDPYDNTNLAGALNAKQDEIDQNNMLSADLVDDTTTNHKFVTSTDITNWNGKVDANAAITGATKCKITYDEKGLVTAGGDLASTDVTNALGYTPYSSSNPARYITSADLNGYATEQYVDDIVGNIETILHNINSGS